MKTVLKFDYQPTKQVIFLIFFTPSSEELSIECQIDEILALNFQLRALYTVNFCSELGLVVRYSDWKFSHHRRNGFISLTERLGRSFFHTAIPLPFPINLKP